MKIPLIGTSLKALILSLALPLAIKAASLNVDLEQTSSTTEAGYESFAIDDNAVGTITRNYTEFSESISVTLSYSAGEDKFRALSRSNANALLNDFIVVDARGGTASIIVTIDGLPTGNYIWVSNHHDPDDGNLTDGSLGYAFTDANGTQTGTQQATNGADSRTPLGLNFESDGVNPVSLALESINAFAYLNSFVITQINTLNVDLELSGSTTATGYESLSVADNAPGPITKNVNIFAASVDVTLSYSQGEGKFRSISRTDSNDLLKDFIAADGRGGSASIIATISGLPRGLYTWTSYHHDPDDADLTDGLHNYTFSDVNGTQSGTKQASNGAETPTPLSIHFESDGLNPVSIELEVSNEFAFLNSIEISLLQLIIPSYTQWQEAYLPIDIGSKTDDYDGDTLSNFREYMFDGDPTNPSDHGNSRPVYRISKDETEFDFVQRNDDDDLSYQLECATDLASGNWFPVNKAYQQISSGAGAIDEVHSMVPSDGPQMFYRLRVDDEPIQPESPPNVIVIISDDHGYNDLGCFGSPDVLTPNLDGLAANGARLTSFYVTSPVCSPTRAAFLTGRYQHRFGFNGALVGTNVYKEGLSQSETLLPELLQQVGYKTGAVGKWHLGWTSGSYPTDRGFDSFYGIAGGKCDYYTHKNTSTDTNADLYSGTTRVDRAGEYSTDIFTEQAIQFITDNQTDPFFLYLSYTAPHYPMQVPPQEYLDPYGFVPDEVNTNRLKYMTMVTAMDHGIGEVLDSLDTLGLADNTLVLFFSDHGGQINQGGNNDPLRGQKHTIWEGGVRSPAIVRWPGYISPSKVCDEPMMTLDLFDLICKATGAQPPVGKTMDTHDSSGFILDGRVGIERDHFLFKHGNGTPSYALRSGNYKLVTDTASNTTNALYDLSIDIGETTDISAANPEITSDLLNTFNSLIETLEGDL